MVAGLRIDRLGLGCVLSPTPTPTATPTSTPHPAFFTGETALGGGWDHLQFPNGTPFGYYSYLPDQNFIYHIDLGFEYLIDANDANHGIYFYDFASSSFFYTSPSTLPFSLQLQPKRVALLRSGRQQSGPLHSRPEMVLQLRDRPVDNTIGN